jgi:hypothetical protein
MLRADVEDLASRSLQAALVERYKAFPDQMRLVTAELANKGIARSGYAFTVISNAALKECDLRVDIAANELQRAAESKGVRYDKDLGKDLGAALEANTQNLCANIETAAASMLRLVPNAGEALGRFQSGLQMARTARLAKGRADLEHYAESLHSRDQERARQSRLKVWQGVVIAAISAALALFGNWIAHLLHLV